MKYINQSGIENFLDNELGDAQSATVAQAFVDQLRIRIDEVKVKDSEWKEIVKKQRKRRTVKVDSDLSGFISD
jgi:predicted phage-related endonuclease